MKYLCKSYQKRILVVTCLAASLVPFMGSSINLALPQIARELTMNGVVQSWTLTAYLLLSAILQVPFGRLADIWGKRTVFIAGLCIFAITTCCCGFATNSVTFIILRALQGVGSAMIFCTNIAILSSVFPPKERGTAMGINVAIVYISIAAGPPIGGIITQYLGWKYIFFITAIISAIALTGSLMVMKERWVESKGEPFDLKGSIIYGLAIAALIYGLTILPGILGIALIILSVGLLFLFVRHESAEKFPVFNISLLKDNKTFRRASLTALINYATTFPIGFLISLYLQEVKTLDAKSAGMILIIQPIIQAVLSPFAGKLSDKVQPRILALSGMALISVVLLAIALLIRPDSSLILLVITLGLLGVGFAAFSSPNTNAIMGSVEKKNYSLASATTGTVRLIGQAFSMGVTTLIISNIIGNQPINHEVSAELMKVIHTTFILFALLSALGVYSLSSQK